MSRTAIAILNTEHLLHNLNVVKTFAGSSKIVGMVKANAYGHGLRSVSKRLDTSIDMLGVASIDEALALRESGVKTAILLAEGVFEQSELIIASTEGFHVVFHNIEQVNWLKKAALIKPINAWLKANTGMYRLGFHYSELATYYNMLKESKAVGKICIMSHFACADIMEHPLNSLQASRFNELMAQFQAEYSICNSSAMITHPELRQDYVRPGLLLYGVSPFPGKSAAELGIKPVMTLQSSIIAIQRLSKGESIGYGATYIADSDSLIGIAAFGYGDGYPISASNGVPVLVNNIPCKTVGRVSMDMLAIDISSCNNVCIGDPVVLWGQGLPIEDVSRACKMIPWTMLTGVQNRVKFLWTR